jgi:hypothetical protein
MLRHVLCGGEEGGIDDSAAAHKGWSIVTGQINCALCFFF